MSHDKEKLFVVWKLERFRISVYQEPRKVYAKRKEDREKYDEDGGNIKNVQSIEAGLKIRRNLG